MAKYGIAFPAFKHAFETLFEGIEEVIPEEDISKYDLIVFSGGNDISPTIYKEENKFSYGISAQRDARELTILKKALVIPTIKILGVCRGHQLINAYLGASFVQDINKQLREYHGGSHNLDSVVEDSVIGKFFTVANSMHHQGTLDAGVGLKITSKYKSIVESTENQRIITTQFHPEFMGGQANGFFEYLKTEWINS